MEKPVHQFTELFAQLGLPSDLNAIKKPLPDGSHVHPQQKFKDNRHRGGQ